MRFRGKSIRRKVGALVLVPLLSLAALWACAATVTMSDARRAGAAGDAADTLTGPVLAVVDAVQEERRQTLVHLADPRRAEGLDALTATHETADAATRRVRDLADDAGDGLGTTARARLDGLLAALDGLGRLREAVGSNTTSRPDALDAYTGVVGPAFRLLDALRPVADPDHDAQGGAVVALARARDLLSQEDALVAGALAFGRTTEDELRTLADLMAQRRLTLDTALPELTVEDREVFEEFTGGGTVGVLTAAEQNLIDGRTATVQADRWQAATAAALDELTRLTDQARDRYRDGVEPGASGLRTRALLLGAVGLAAVALSAFVALRTGRSLVRDLRALAREATESADVKLPGVTRRLAAGEHIDVETEAPRLDYGPDEIGRVGQALNTLQRAAVSATVERTRTRRGISQVFVNVARRNQVLLHRQLNLIESLERRTEDPEDAGDLVRAAHLAFRMRRHAEGLVVLSGAAPARQWRKPESLMDVVRAAVREVEDFERVEVRMLPPLTVAGGAVADLVHLVAELLENATLFSPPHTAVQVSGERVPHGFTLEIHDRGLGMAAEALHEANQRLAESPEFEPSDTDRVGLFVIARLARRHGVRVALRESPYGGTTAVTLIPGELLTEAREEAPRRLTHVPGRPALHGGVMDGPVELDGPVGVGHAADGVHEHAHAAGPEAAREPGRPGDRPGLPRRHRAPVLVSDHGRPVGPRSGAEDAPGPADTPADTPGEPPEPAAPATTATGLPRRVRRAQAAPTGPPPVGRSGDDVADDADAEEPELDADEIRARMAALQRGWRRGREQNGERPGRPSA
ncbi:nitrate- and nitrite sensing domain-containing protein [Streptomyces avicenniae]|uniref:sensor histidine kinase n=1 Tax=Streptomyces avicenniae TaxID=500153 RepID=UPI00069B5F1E|nr:nitrate- and nitrite sensing domain-containing protein [Streptomyces avicenniae]